MEANHSGKKFSRPKNKGPSKNKWGLLNELS